VQAPKELDSSTNELNRTEVRSQEMMMVLRFQSQVVVEVVVAVDAKLGVKGEEDSGMDDETDDKRGKEEKGSMVGDETDHERGKKKDSMVDDETDDKRGKKKDSRDPLLPYYIFGAASAGFLIILGVIVVAVRKKTAPVDPPISYLTLRRLVDVQDDVESARGGEDEFGKYVAKEKKSTRKTAKPEKVPNMIWPKPEIKSEDTPPARTRTSAAPPPPPPPPPPPSSSATGARSKRTRSQGRAGTTPKIRHERAQSEPSSPRNPRTLSTPAFKEDLRRTAERTAERTAKQAMEAERVRKTEERAGRRARESRSPANRRLEISLARAEDEEARVERGRREEAREELAREEVRARVQAEREARDQSRLSRQRSACDRESERERHRELEEKLARRRELQAREAALQDEYAEEEELETSFISARSTTTHAKVLTPARQGRASPTGSTVVRARQAGPLTARPFPDQSVNRSPGISGASISPPSTLRGSASPSSTAAAGEGDKENEDPGTTKDGAAALAEQEAAASPRWTVHDRSPILTNPPRLRDGTEEPLSENPREASEGSRHSSRPRNAPDRYTGVEADKSKKGSKKKK
jgi:hypothetical protein